MSHPSVIDRAHAPDRLATIDDEIVSLIGEENATAIYPIWAGYWFELFGGRDEGDKGMARDLAFAHDVAGSWRAAYDAAAVTGTERGRRDLVDRAEQLRIDHPDTAPEILAIIGQLCEAITVADVQRNESSNRQMAAILANVKLRRQLEDARGSE